VRAGIRALLDRAAGVKIVGEASSMDEFPPLVTERSPDLLLLSPMNNVAASLEVLRSVRTKAAELCVMLIVREENSLDVSRALLLGRLGYVNLALPRDAFLRAVRRTARGERVVEPALLDRVLKNLAHQPAEPGGMLSVPELDVLRLLSEGHTNPEIARRLRYSLSTVKDYVQKILLKLEAPNRTQAAVKAVRLGL
jgi:DNA-binding NarL/FixJ family response regulator